VCTFPLLLLTPNSSPARSVADFIALARQRAGKMTYASPGVATIPHLAGELLKQMAGFEMTHVPYRGDAPALTDTIAGRVDLQIAGSAMIEQVKGGQVRGLAVSTATRSPAAPAVPTVAESGVPGFDVTGWFALFAPARTPQAIVRKMQADTVAALSDPGARAKLEQIGMVVTGTSSEELAALVKSETEKWGATIREAKISLD
jgi:tripartite-type tricarboxylate transporter receptor subunit TctC